MSVLTIASVATVNAQQLNIPQPSPNTNIRQAFATSFIELNYSRPSVRGRVVFGRGGLVAMGKVWRTGANAATTITFGEEVSVNGVKLPKRKYGLLTIPSASEWTIILSKDTTVTSASDYKQENDAVRFTVKPVKLPSLVETFTIDIANVRPKGDACDIRIMWEKTMVSFTVSADIDSKIMAQIDEAMKGEKKPYYSAARYYYDNGKDLKKALEWVDEAIKARPEAYWIVLLKAQIQFKLADYTGAIATAKQCAEIAKKDENDEYVKKAEAIVADSEKAKGK
jgi:hypothetical protein